MFVLCPHCQFLVATDSATGQPPSHCTHCGGLLVPESVPAPVTAAGESAIEVVVDPPAVAPSPSAAGDDSTPTPTPTQAAVAEIAEAQAPVEIADDAIPVADGDDDALEVPVDPESPSPAKPHATADTARSSGGASTPGFVRRQRLRSARAPHTHGWMVAAVAVLSLLLVLQLLLADRAGLARDARWRPALATLCNVLHCTLPPWREPAAFILLDRNVRPRVDKPGVLHVTATFRNNARWPQPWPALLLTLSDLDGRVAGARVFAPREYLGGAPTQPLLASGQSAMLAMDVVEPGPRIVAFTFDFQ